jgi:hypothetical protein
VRINLRNTRNGDWRDVDAIAVTPDGDFHPVWIDAGKGSGEVRTAAIQIVPPDTLVADATNGLENVTEKVAVLYGGDQHYDEQTGTLTLDVTIKNDSDHPLRRPLRLALTSFYRDSGDSEVTNAENGATGAGSVWDLTPSIPENELAPGATSKPFPLRFRYHVDPGQQRGPDDILGLSAKVYAAGPTQAANSERANARSAVPAVLPVHE